MRFTVKIPLGARLSEKTIKIALPHGETLMIGCTLLAAVVAWQFSAFGSDADLSYYGTLAQVIPVFLVAAVLESRTRLGNATDAAAQPLRERVRELRDLEKRHQEADLAQDDRAKIATAIGAYADDLKEIERDLLVTNSFARRLIRSYVILAISGEVSALGALAAGHGGAFVFCLASLSLISMAIMWTTSMTAALDLRPVLERDSGAR